MQKYYKKQVVNYKYFIVSMYILHLYFIYR